MDDNRHEPECECDFDDFGDLEPKNFQEQAHYLMFMENPENIMNCDGCPENREHRGYKRNLGTGEVGPCHQQHCWVPLSCKDNDDEE